MKQNLVITIGRQFGSGGREVGKRLAELFGIDYFDKELINEAAKESGLSPEFFEKADEKAPRSLRNFFTVVWTPFGSSFGSDGSLNNETIFKYQSDVIINITNTKPCVIVGRCADYILRNCPSCVSVFIHAPLKNRIDRIISRSGEDMTPEEAAELAEKKNKMRQNYYNFFTDKEWGAAASYDLSIDSSILGCEGTALFVKEFIEKKFNGKI